MTSDTDQFRDLLDRWEELHEQGQEPNQEELCRDAPHLTERLREWTRVLTSGDWLNRRADEVADETLGEHGTLTAEEKDRYRTLGEYDLLEELGGGGMGRVFRAVHRKMNRTVAVKLLPQSLVQSPESLERFQREIQALARLSHPNIVAVHDAGMADGTHYYVMDMVDGEDLARVVREHGPMPVEQAINCILQAARGLEYAHAQGIVHRDIKPSNLILDGNGTVKILDLGIARLTPTAESADDLTKTGCVLGTVDYMAPEQAINTRLADHRADIYSLGCTLWFLLTAEPIFGGDTVMERIVAHREHAVPSLKKACPAVPMWLDGVFRKMVAKKPEDRYQSVTALISDLAGRSAPRRTHWRGIAAAIVALVLVAGFSLLFHRGTWGNKTNTESAAMQPKTNTPANDLAAGKHLCFVENKWDEGLPLLARGSDVELKRLATAELNENATPQQRLRLGDRWWDFAGNAVGLDWKAAQQRAAYWYRQAVPIRGPRKAEIEKRLKDLELLPLGFEVLARQARILPDESHGSAHSSNLFMEVTKNSMSSPGAAYVGLELKGLRFLDVAVNASPKIERVNKNSFVGFMVDYHTASGYERRVALGIGVLGKNRMDKAPHWGKNEVPDQYVDLGSHNLYGLDLRQWAPQGWDGQVWFTLVLQQAGLGTFVTAQLVPLTKLEESKPAEPLSKPKESAPEQKKAQDSPVKPTWRTVGEYPLIAGVWVIVGSKGRRVTVTQHGGDFVATTSYKSDNETVSWRAEGKISTSGHLTMNLVHTQPHPPDKWLPQTRTADLDPNGKALEGYAAFEGGGHKFTWKLVEARKTTKKEFSQ
jgi:serine/threonine protein kinase